MKITELAESSTLGANNLTMVVDGSANKKTKLSTLKAWISESPTLTGTPKAPTAAKGTNNTQIATTAFVHTAVNATSNPTITWGSAVSDGTFGAVEKGGICYVKNMHFVFQSAKTIASDTVLGTLSVHPGSVIRFYAFSGNEQPISLKIDTDGVIRTGFSVPVKADRYVCATFCFPCYS